jgi:YgiT-type zinc finger domain-containing protein
MIGVNGSNSLCAVCGGQLRPGLATIPFVFDDTVVLIKGVPAEICASCHEPFTTGRVTDRLTELLGQLRAVHTEVSIVTYTDPTPEVEQLVA